MVRAVSKSTWAPSTAACMARRGAFIGEPLSCLVRFAGKDGRLAANLGFFGSPPGILKPLTSHGCSATASSDSSQARARSRSSSGATTSSTRPTFRALPGFICAPVRMTFISASWMPIMRTTRVMPPPPGSRPRVTSGRPILEPRASAAMRWLAASATSRPPPSAAPLMAATTGTGSFSMRRSDSFMCCTMSNIDWASSGPTCDICLMSPPAKNVFLAEVRMMPLMPPSPPSASSCSSFSTVARTSSWKVWFIVLTGAFGSSIVSVTMPSSVRSQRNMLSVIVSVSPWFPWFPWWVFASWWCPRRWRSPAGRGTGDRVRRAR